MMWKIWKNSIDIDDEAGNHFFSDDFPLWGDLPGAAAGDELDQKICATHAANLLAAVIERARSDALRYIDLSSGASPCGKSARSAIIENGMSALRFFQSSRDFCLYAMHLVGGGRTRLERAAVAEDYRLRMVAMLRRKMDGVALVAS